MNENSGATIPDDFRDAHMDVLFAVHRWQNLLIALKGGGVYFSDNARYLDGGPDWGMVFDVLMNDLTPRLCDKADDMERPVERALRAITNIETRGELEQQWRAFTHGNIANFQEMLSVCERAGRYDVDCLTEEKTNWQGVFESLIDTTEIMEKRLEALWDGIAKALEEAEKTRQEFMTGKPTKATRRKDRE
jgi:hypothetical protein